MYTRPAALDTGPPTRIAPDAPASIHSIPLTVQGMVWLMALVAGVVFIAALSVPYLAPGDFGLLYLAYPASVLSGLLAIYAIRQALALRDRFMVDEKGIIRLRPGRPVSHFSWGQFTRGRQRPLLQRLDLVFRDGDVCRLEYQLTAFETLAEAVAKHVGEAPGSTSTRALTPAGQRTASFEVDYVFRRGHAPWLLPVLVPAIVFGSGAVFGGVLIGAWLLAGTLLFSWLAGWTAIRIEGGDLIIERPFRSRRIPAGQLCGVDLVMEEGQSSGKRASVEVFTADGRVESLTGVRGGEMGLYAALSRLRDALAVPAAGDNGNAGGTVGSGTAP